MAVRSLRDLQEQPDPAVTLFLLGDILNRFNRFNSSDMSISSFILVLFLCLFPSALYLINYFGRLSYKLTGIGFLEEYPAQTWR